jgi:hypothetical protein
VATIVWIDKRHIIVKSGDDILAALIFLSSITVLEAAAQGERVASHRESGSRLFLGWSYAEAQAFPWTSGDPENVRR